MVRKLVQNKYLLFVIFLLALQLIPVIQTMEARLTAEVYIAMKYYDKQLQYQRMEFDTHFGEYLVTYQYRSGESASLMIKPKFLPFIVSYDPFDTSR